MNLEVIQVYADKCSDKLHNNTKPVLRWETPDCSVGKNNLAHCHISNDGVYPRGVICINAEVANLSVNEWHHGIAHEVVHLRALNHYSVRFARRMVKLRFTKFYSDVILAKEQQRKRRKK